MDTRTKIMSAEEALGRFPEACYVSAYLDPLLASHAARLEEVADGRPVVVILADPPEPLLGARSRAELAAGLRVVQAVVLPGDPAADSRIEAREESADLDRRAGLIQRVHGRHTG